MAAPNDLTRSLLYDDLLTISLHLPKTVLKVKTRTVVRVLAAHPCDHVAGRSRGSLLPPTTEDGSTCHRPRKIKTQDSKKSLYRICITFTPSESHASVQQKLTQCFKSTTLQQKGFPADSGAKNLLPVQETEVWSWSREAPLQKGMATHSSILVWRIPWTEESGGLQSMGSWRVRHDWVTKYQKCSSKFVFLKKIQRREKKRVIEYQSLSSHLRKLGKGEENKSKAKVWRKEGNNQNSEDK